MCVAYYSVAYDSNLFPKSCILKVYKEDAVVKTLNFPIRNPHNLNKAMNEARKAGALLVKKIIDEEMLK